MQYQCLHYFPDVTWILIHLLMLCFNYDFIVGRACNVKTSMCALHRNNLIRSATSVISCYVVAPFVALNNTMSGSHFVKMVWFSILLHGNILNWKVSERCITAQMFWNGFGSDDYNNISKVNLSTTSCVYSAAQFSVGTQFSPHHVQS